MSFFIIGSGSWGTALAQILANNDNKVQVWCRNSQKAKHYNSAHRNIDYHPDILLHENIVFTHKHEQASQAQHLIYALPSYAIDSTLDIFNTDLLKGKNFISTAKGIRQDSLHTLSEHLQGKMGKTWLDQHYAVLSGPSFAHDVVRQKPTAVCLASINQNLITQLQQAFHQKSFHTYANNDVIGVELGAALKNVVAIAAGIVDELDLGPSARSALITRGLSEIISIGIKKNARMDTFTGLSGLGDLLLTCSSKLSRNKRIGHYLAQGLSLKAAIKKLGQVAEGIRSCKSAYQLSKELNLDNTIFKHMFMALYENLSLDQCIESILNQKVGTELPKSIIDGNLN